MFKINIDMIKDKKANISEIWVRFQISKSFENTKTDVVHMSCAFLDISKTTVLKESFSFCLQFKNKFVPISCVSTI